MIDQLRQRSNEFSDRKVLNRSHEDYDWRIHFFEADCRTLIDPVTPYYHIATVDDVQHLSTPAL
jgi:hypothetical protein